MKPDSNAKEKEAGLAEVNEAQERFGRLGIIAKEGLLGKTAMNAAQVEKSDRGKVGKGSPRGMDQKKPSLYNVV